MEGPRPVGSHQPHGLLLGRIDPRLKAMVGDGMGRRMDRMSEQENTCPHCGSSLKKWLVPEEATWDDEFFMVCFNNDCSYYKRGWEWMKEQ